MPIPAILVAALDILNQGRSKVGCFPFVWSDTLCLSATSLADWGWDNYIHGKANVSADAHHDWLGRLGKAGWTYTDERGMLLPGPPPGRRGTTNTSEYGIDGDGQTKGEDGKEYPKDPSGWSHPFRTPETHAKRVVWTLTESDLSRDRSEGHVWDFHAGWTHIGIGYNAGIFVLDYGYLPGEPVPEPELLRREDFDVIAQ